jgi:hypothetical protein
MQRIEASAQPVAVSLSQSLPSNGLIWTAIPTDISVVIRILLLFLMLHVTKRIKHTSYT